MLIIKVIYHFKNFFHNIIVVCMYSSSRLPSFLFKPKQLNCCTIVIKLARELASRIFYRDFQSPVIAMTEHYNPQEHTYKIIKFISKSS